MHRGVRVDGVTVQRLRRSKGLSQIKLAQDAGVSERTVRNAEKGQILESHIASYLAVALNVPLNEIVAERANPSRSRRLQRLIRKVSSLYMQAILDLEWQALMEIVHPSIEWNCCAAPDQRFSGRFCGMDGLRLHLKLASRWWEPYAAQAGNLSLRRMDAEGDMAYFLLDGKFKNEADSGIQIWQTFICRFDEDLLVSVDQSLGVTSYALKHVGNSQQT